MTFFAPKACKTYYNSTSNHSALIVIFGMYRTTSDKCQKMCHIHTYFRYTVQPLSNIILNCIWYVCRTPANTTIETVAYSEVYQRFFYNFIELNADLNKCYMWSFRELVIHYSRNRRSVLFSVWFSVKRHN